MTFYFISCKTFTPVWLTFKFLCTFYYCAQFSDIVKSISLFLCGFRVSVLFRNSKESTCNWGYLGSVPGLGRSSGERKGYPLWFSGLENSMDCIAHRVTMSQTWLSDFHFHFHSYQLKQKHFSVLPSILYFPSLILILY